jgi:hypothetical protein
MTPVISPWVFYWMPVIDTMSGVAWVLLIVSVVLLVISFFIFCMELDCGDKDSDLCKFLLKAKNKLLVLIVAATIAGVFIPSEKTVIKMLIAQNVTYDRVEMATDTVASVYEDIMSLFEKSSDSNG